MGIAECRSIDFVYRMIEGGKGGDRAMKSKPNVS